MEGSFILGIFEVMIYLAPGLLILISFYVLFGQKIKSYLDFTKEKSNSIIIITALILSMLVGVVNHSLSSVTFTVAYDRVLGISRLDQLSRGFRQMDSIKTKVNRVIADTTKMTNFSVYRYMNTYIEEHSKGAMERVDRLLVYTLFTRNIVLPTLLLFIIVYIKEKIYKKGMFYNIIYFVFFIGLIGIILKTYDDYVIAHILAVFRTFMVL